MRKLASTGIHLTLIGVIWYPVDSILNQLVSVNRFTIDRSVYWDIYYYFYLLFSKGEGFQVLYFEYSVL